MFSTFNFSRMKYILLVMFTTAIFAISFNAVSTEGRSGIPSSSIFPMELVFSHPVLNFSAVSPVKTVANLYAHTVKEQMESLGLCIKQNTVFHLDGLAHSVSASAANLTDFIERIGPTVSTGGELTYDEYEFLMNKVSLPGYPSIDSRQMDAEILMKGSRQFTTGYNIIYVDNIFDTFTFEALQREVTQVWKSSDLEPNCNLDGENRMGGYVHLNAKVPIEQQHQSLYNLIFANEPLRLWISAITGHNVYASDFPIELREYGNNSAGMACHSDVQMYADVSKNFEVVVTISNHGESDLHWFDRDNKKHSIRPKANSITIVQPNAAVHCVSGANGGFREILKFIYVGSYEKHRNFFRYVNNKCSSTNPNVKAVRKKRKDMRVTRGDIEPADISRAASNIGDEL